MAGAPPGKIAIVSHILPPSPSGQATVLARLLQGIDPDRYILLSRERYDGTQRGEDAGEPLSARYYAFRSPPPVPPAWRLTGSFLRFVGETFVWIRDRARQIEEIARKEGCDLLVACSGDLYDLPAACLAGRKTGIPFIPYLFDDYLYQWTGRNRSASRRMEPWLMRQAKAAIVPNEFLREEYVRRYGIRCAVVRNPCPVPDLDALDRAPRVFPGESVNIVYAGAVYHANCDALRNLVTAIRKLGRPGVRLHVYTAQAPEEIARIGISGPEVVHHRHIPAGEIPAVLRQASILFLPLGFNTPISEVIRTSAPGKMGEYLSVGRPVLVHAPWDSFVSGYFRENGCGLVADRSDPDLLSTSIERLLSDADLCAELGVRARSAAERDFDVGAARLRFEEALREFARVRVRDA